MNIDHPYISVVMPVRNEVDFIAGTIDQLLAQDYPKDRFEIIVADGMSDDGTREIVRRVAVAERRVRLLDNPKRRSSAGRNVGFKSGRGELFVVVDGHCHIPDDQFLQNIVDCFEKSGADCLGRPQPLDPPGLTPFQASVALARASRLGHGGDSLIYADYEGFASPVSNGAAYRREVFDCIGYVDENFDACEDVEFNYRLEQAGLKTYTSPRLTVRYFPRENLPALLSQMRRYGRGRTRLYRNHPSALSISALAPVCFAGCVAAFIPLFALDQSFGLSAFLGFLFNTLGLALLAYAVLVGVVTVRICREHDWGHVMRLPFIFPAIHGGLGLGMWEEYLATTRGLLNRHRKADGSLRIAFLIDTIESPTAGTERQLLLLLAGLDRREFEPRLCVLKSSEWLEREFHLCLVHDLGISSFKNPISWWRVLRFALWLRREKVDILQVHFRDASLAGLPAAWLARVPGIVGTRRNQGYWMTGRELFLQKALNLIPDAFVANSEATRQWAHRTEGLEPERIRVIHNGFEGEIASGHDGEAKVRARERLGVSMDAPVVGIVANLREVKRIDVFLRAAAVVAQDIGQAVFVVVGEGDERTRLERLSAELGLAGQVIFLGRRTDVLDLLPAFDVGVLSSDSESFSNSVLQYMAAGLPVAATDVGGCREALGDSPAGLLVHPGDADGLGRAVLQLLADQGAVEFARKKHPDRVRELFSKERYTRAYSDFFRGLCVDTRETIWAHA